MKSLQQENERIEDQLNRIESERKKAHDKLSTLERVSFSFVFLFCLERIDPSPHFAACNGRKRDKVIFARLICRQLNGKNNVC